MLQRIKELISKGYSYQMLETANWIEVKHESGLATFAVLFFYETRDIAIHLEIFNDKTRELAPLKDIAVDPETRFKNALFHVLRCEACKMKVIENAAESLAKDFAFSIEVKIPASLFMSYLTGEQGRFILGLLEKKKF